MLNVVYSYHYLVGFYHLIQAQIKCVFLILYFVEMYYVWFWRFFYIIVNEINLIFNCVHAEIMKTVLKSLLLLGSEIWTLALFYSRSAPLSFYTSCPSFIMPPGVPHHLLSLYNVTLKHLILFLCVMFHLQSAGGSESGISSLRVTGQRSAIPHAVSGDGIEH